MGVAWVLWTIQFLVLTIWLIKRRKKMSILKTNGIPGPRPSLIFGNLKELNKKGIHIALRDWEKQYGKVFGYYLGAQPTIVICDADLCKQIQIKDFSNFVNRPKLIPGRGKNRFQQHVINSDDEKWKEQRSLMTPTFTTGKMKQMVELVVQSIDVLMSKVESASKSGSEFNIHEYFKGLTLDVIAKAAFGVQTNVQNDTNDLFYRGAQDVIREDTFKGLVGLSVCFPELAFIFNRITIVKSYISLYLETNMVRAFFNTCADVVMARRSNPKNRREDLLQLLVDAEISHQDIHSGGSDHLTVDYESDAPIEMLPMKDSIKGKSSRRAIKLTDEEVMSNTFIMLFAGYETTSTALAYMSHVLVNHPEIQEKMREEIQSVSSQEGGISYNCIPKLKYLDQVWSETLRYYPPVPSFVNRVAIKDIQYEDVKIPKGVTVQIAVSVLHKSPDYWIDPWKFDPERFSPDRHSEINQMAYQPFGAGPRNCIGLRFAQMEAKLAMARLLNEYRLVPSAKTEIGDISVTMKFVIMSPKNGVNVKAEKI